MMNQIILASKSPRRLEIMEEFGFSCSVSVPQNVYEVSLGEEGFECPSEVVIENSCRKCRAVGGKGSWVLGSDTIVVLGDRQFGKPKSLEEAFEFLSLLSGVEHSVLSGFCLRNGNVEHKGVEETKVLFKTLLAKDIESYLSQVEVLDKAGAYAIQECRDIIIDSWKGSYYNVMGLPIESFVEFLREKNIS